MDHSSKPVPVVPNRRLPNILGILNIVFASGFLLCGLCWGGSSLMTPRFMKMMDVAQKKSEELGRKQQERDLEALEAQEKAALSEAEKAELREMRERVKVRPLNPAAGMMDWKRMGVFDPKLIAWTWTEILTGLAVNLMLLASGIGLVQYKSWGRKLGVWTAAAKIVRLVLVYGYCTMVIVPDFSRGSARSWPSRWPNSSK